MSNRNSVIQKLLRAGFFLGGSRRMAEKFPDVIKVTPETDWDFYAASTSANREILTKMGFEEVNMYENVEKDDLLKRIYKHPGLNVQVLLRYDVGIYNVAFETISGDTFLHLLWKSSPIRTDALSKEEFATKVRNHMNKLFENVARTRSKYE